MSMPIETVRLLNQIEADPGFIAVLDQAGASLVVTAAPGQAICLGAEAGQLTAAATPFASPFGVAHDGNRLALTTQRCVEIYALSRPLAAPYPARPNHYDAICVPIGQWRTGECRMHEIHLHGPSVIGVNTQFSCISRSDMRHSFEPLWRPSFISGLMPEDRCHLNSFAVDVQGRIRYATAFAETDAPRGYRDLPLASGVIIDVLQNKIIGKGLGMPHSVRLYDGMIHVLDSASGALWRLDPQSGAAEEIVRLPGFTRGLCRLGNILMIGLSPLRDTAKARNLPVFATGEVFHPGIAAVDLGSGQVVGMLGLPPSLNEVFDIATVPGVRRLHIQDPAVDHLTAIETPNGGYWMSIEERKQSNDIRA